MPKLLLCHIRAQLRFGSVLGLVFCLAGGPARADLLSQLASSEKAAERDRDAASAARRMGNNSISRGHSNINHGHHHGVGGAPQVALGVMQVAQGILALLAALKAQDLAKKNKTNAGGLSALAPPGVADSAAAPDFASRSESVAQETVTRAAGEDSTAASRASNGWAAGADGRGGGLSLSPQDLRSGELGAALSDIQDQFGYSPEQFTRALSGGADPRTLLAKAPKNALSLEEARQAYEAALLSAGLAEGGNVVADARGILQSAAGDADGGGSGRSEEVVAGGAGEEKPGGGLRDRLARGLASEPEGEGEELALSPEVAAALAARDQARRQEQRRELSLFEVVHLKYLEKQRTFYSPIGKAQGVGNAEGN